MVAHFSRSIKAATLAVGSGLDTAPSIAFISVHALERAAMKSLNWCAEERTFLNGRTCSDHCGGPHHVPDAGGFSTFCAPTLHLPHVSPLLLPSHLLFLGSAQYRWH